MNDPSPPALPSPHASSLRSPALVVTKQLVEAGEGRCPAKDGGRWNEGVVTGRNLSMDIDNRTTRKKDDSL